jgi:hypothetical protein
MTGGSQTAPARLPAPRGPEAPRPTDPDPADAAALDLVEGAGPAEAPARRRLPRHWTWALTATAATCALWAAGLTVWQHAQPDGPDLHGYQLAGSPCARSSLAPLVGTSPSHAYTNPAVFSHGPALDRAECSAGTVANRTTTSEPQSSTVTVTVELHKKTDPRAEFDDQRALILPTLVPASRVIRVPGLGDEAYFLVTDPDQIDLKVLHGGLVLQLAYTVNREGTAESALIAVSPADGTTIGESTTTGTPPDVTGAYRKPLIAAARNVLANLAS